MNDPNADPLSRGTQPTRADLFWKSGILLALVATLIASLRGGLPRMVAGLWLQAAVPNLAVVGLAMAAGSVLYGAICFYHALRYRPLPPPDDAGLPTCTVIVPAFNEGPMVRISLLSALASDYPADKLEVIAIDDGSTDDTWAHIEAVAAAHPGRVKALRQPQNRGKREALRRGFLNAKGDVVVTVDSDSQLEPGALRAAAAPLVADPDVSAVAGKVVVLNRYESLLTRLLAARFFLTFDFSRAVQSRFGAVLCCPGALTAYRRAAVMRVLDRWSAQTFLGTPCTIGEDRALTTWLLREGGRAVYQGNAVVRTLVPAHLRGVVRMLIRWERGNVRENLVMFPVFFTPWRSRDRLWPMLDVTLDLLQFPIGLAMSAAAIIHFTAHPVAILGSLSMMGLVAFVQSLYCLRSEGGTDFLYNVGYVFFAAFGLAWVFPYSCVTLRNGAWLTR
ncbi:Glycosyltransferase [Minicystis rosea]|nr:Glycosyltransferase [Minicystis rosea]